MLYLCYAGDSALVSLEQRLGINFSVLVLTAGSWPFHQANIPTLTIPQELVKSVQVGLGFVVRNVTNVPRFRVHLSRDRDQNPRFTSEIRRVLQL